ncbi:hypothetical protein EDD85DRAFT_956492 [Armillaria nabsnona]|nr:hypothetical protein EDD85DRAFT_956492 [Armillaria nabsnona]
MVRSWPGDSHTASRDTRFSSGIVVFPVVALGCYPGSKKAQVISRFKALDEKCLMEPLRPAD